MVTVMILIMMVNDLMIDDDYDDDDNLEGVDCARDERLHAIPIQ